MYAYTHETGAFFRGGAQVEESATYFSRPAPHHPAIRELTLEGAPNCPSVWVYAESQLRTLEDAPSAPFGE